MVSFVEERDRAAHAARARPTRPDDVVVHRIGRGEAAFAPRHGMPQAARDRARAAASASTAAEAAKLQAVARAAKRRAVLPVAINEVGDLVVDRHVIHLRDWKLDLVPRAAAVHRDANAAVVDDGHTVSIGGVDPHLVVVPAGT